MSKRVIALNFNNSEFIYIGEVKEETEKSFILKRPIKMGHNNEGVLLFTRAASYSPQKYVEFNKSLAICYYDADSVATAFYEKAVKFLKKTFTQQTHRELIQYINMIDQQITNQGKPTLDENNVRIFIAQTMKDLINQARENNSLPGEALPTLGEQKAAKEAETKQSEPKIEEKKKRKIVN